MRLQRHQRQTLSRLEKEINYTCIHDLMALDAESALLMPKPVHSSIAQEVQTPLLSPGGDSIDDFPR